MDPAVGLLISWMRNLLSSSVLMSKIERFMRISDYGNWGRLDIQKFGIDNQSGKITYGRKIWHISGSAKMENEGSFDQMNGK